MTPLAERRFYAQPLAIAIALCTLHVCFNGPLLCGPPGSLDGAGPNPTEHDLSQNVPNPFCPLEGGTEIRFDLASTAYARLRVSMITRGAALLQRNPLRGVDPADAPKPRVLIDGFLPAGRHAVHWDGRDTSGEVAPDGNYMYSLILSADSSGQTFYAMTLIATVDCGHGDLLFRDTWEAGTLGAWVVDGGEWEVGTPAYGPDSLFEGDCCIGTVMDSAYSDGADALLLSPLIELPLLAEGERILFSFWHWYRIGSGDSGQVGVKPVDGAWEALDGACFTLHSPCWTPYWMDLSDWAGQDVALGFRLFSDAVSHDAGWFIDDIRVGAGQIVFRNPEDFEMPSIRWLSEGGIWQIGTPQVGPGGAYEGSSCAATVLAGDYDCSCRACLVSLPVYLNRSVAADQVSLRFKHWHELGSGDSAFVVIRTDGTKSTLEPVFTYRSSGWADAVFDLTPFMDTRIQIAFCLASDEADAGAGWFVDDIELDGIPNVARSRVSFANTVVGDTSSTILFIRNRSAHEVVIDHADRFGSAFLVRPQFADSLNLGVPIAPGSFVITEAYFAPPQSGAHAGKLVFYERDARDTLAAIDLRGEASPLGLTWLNAHEYPGNLVADRERISLQVITGDRVHVDSLLLYYRKGGETEFRASRMQILHEDSLNQTYSGAIPSLLVGPRGIEFCFGGFNGVAREATPPVESPIVLRVSVDDLTFPGPQPAGAYEMISVPLEPQVGSPILELLQDDLGLPDDYQWRLFMYDTDKEGYTQISEGNETPLGHGYSYWLITREGGSIDTGPVTALSTRTDGCSEIALAPGWNMIGNPFSFPVNWDSVTVDSMDMEEAWADLVVERWPWTWVAEGSHYDTVAILQPFHGYWVRNLQESDMVSLCVPPMEADTLASQVLRLLKSASAPGKSNEQTWRIGIGARCGAFEDRGCLAGMSLTSITSIDKHDRAEPPPSPGRFISVYFPHHDWEHGGGYYAADMREMLEPGAGGCRGHTWRLDVAKNFTGDDRTDEVDLEFTGAGSLPQWVEICLIDRDLMRRVDLRGTQTYSFILGEKQFISCDAEARFLLIAGNSAFVDEETEGSLSPPSVTRLTGIYPNPLTTATRIRYDIRQATDVSLCMYDVKGALIRTVERGRREPGRYEAVWHGDTRAGSPASPGIYFCRFETGGGIEETRKIIVVK